MVYQITKEINSKVYNDKIFVLVKNVEVNFNSRETPDHSWYLVIQNQLEEFIASERQPSTISNYEPYKLLRNMKEQQDYNERSLIALRRRLFYPGR